MLPGASLSTRVLGLLLAIYVGLAIVLYLPRGRGALGLSTIACLAAHLYHDDLGLALGIAGTAQSRPRSACVLRIPVSYPHPARRSGLRHGECAAAIVPIYLLIRVRLLTLFGPPLSVTFAILRRTADERELRRDLFRGLGCRRSGGEAFRIVIL